MNAAKCLRHFKSVQIHQCVNVVSNSALGERTVASERLKMRGWQIHNYGNLDELQCSGTLKMPQIRSSNDCLIRVRATTVNPIDVAMVAGYGATILNALRCRPGEIEFPLILGREFCGEIVQKGMAVGDIKYKIGDRVYGVVPVHAPGAHADYITVPSSCLAKPPAELSDEDAASVLYASLTAWSGLYVSAGLNGMCGAFSSIGGGAQKRVLVLGGSGAVGSAAIQILKSQGAQVLATCSEDALELVRNHGADHVINYKNDAEVQNIRSYAPYDVVLDCAGHGTEYAESIQYDFRQYVTFSSPLLKNFDTSGVAVGIVRNISDLLKSNVKTLAQQGAVVKYGFFMPAPHGIAFIESLVERKKILPVVDTCYSFEEMQKAFEHVQRGHLRGKIVVKL